MSFPPVCILTAGRGTRMGRACRNVNKALLPLQGQAVLSQIIDRFPADAEFIIGLGWQADQIRDYVSIAHPGLSVTYVSIDPFEGAGSGPGYSLLCCRSYLLRPFLFVSCDTLWEDGLDLSVEENWLGCAPVAEDDSMAYCNLQIQKGRVIALRDKQRSTSPDFEAFVGLCGIYDHELFWEALENRTTIQGEHQISNGLKTLIEKTVVKSRSVLWTDAGDEVKYQSAVLRRENFDFSKTDEFIYFRNGRVIKFFANPDIAQKRVQKARLIPGVFPVIDQARGGFYSYPFVEGCTLYQQNTPDLFRRLLEWIEVHLWKLSSEKPSDWKDCCRRFYHDKTLERLSSFREKHPDFPEQLPVNGIALPSTSELISRVPWEKLEDGIPCGMHGDLQFDNILYCPSTNGFVLLDWRQDFAGRVDIGDLYYDLAKLYGGILLPYDYIKLNLLSFEEDSSSIWFDFGQRFLSSSYRGVLEGYVTARGLDLSKVRLLVGLIYLNMAPLHHSPFDRLLYCLGRSILHQETNR